MFLAVCVGRRQGCVKEDPRVRRQRRRAKVGEEGEELGDIFHPQVRPHRRQQRHNGTPDGGPRVSEQAEHRRVVRLLAVAKRHKDGADGAQALVGGEDDAVFLARRVSPGLLGHRHKVDEASDQLFDKRRRVRQQRLAVDTHEVLEGEDKLVVLQRVDELKVRGHQRAEPLLGRSLESLEVGQRSERSRSRRPNDQRCFLVNNDAGSCARCRPDQVDGQVYGMYEAGKRPQGPRPHKGDGVRVGDGRRDGVANQLCHRRVVVRLVGEDHGTPADEEQRCVNVVRR
mmetsp:Transcript_5288/g.17023  ORF Transcript_5288/g.17023 Transcript_5288/m.17023 type:complete len:285 (+) Transcript_5288:2087-2941(+)